MIVHQKTPLIPALLASATVAGPALAQQQSQTQLEDVVVTAQKREQNAQDVGIAMTTLTGEELARLGYTNTSDVVAQSPGVLARRQFPSRGLRSNFFIRGVGSTDFNDATETPVAIYVDDFYMISPSTADFSLMDISRVEILKGPQGTLFGRNTNGGAVQFVTNKPEFEAVAGSGEVTFGTKQTRQLEGVLNVPVGDKFAVRLAAQLDDHGYFTRNVNPEGRPSGDQNYDAVRVQLRFRPVDSVDAVYKFENGKTEGRYGETSPVVTLAQPGGDVIRKPDNTNAYGYNPSSNGTDGPDRNAAEGLYDGYNKIQSHLLTVKWDISESLAFTSITGFLDQRYNVYEDCDGTPSIICNYEGFANSKHYTQEFRLNGASGRVNWTAGLYYLHQDADGGLAAPLYYYGNGFPDPGPVTRGDGYYANFDLKLKAYAAFGQLEFAATDTVTLIGGLRYAKDDKDFEQRYLIYPILTSNTLFPFRSRDSFLLSSHQIIGAPGTINFTKENAGGLTNSNKSSLSGTAQINWRPADGRLFYASVRRGVKGAGFNNGAVDGNITVQDYPYDQEKLMAYEIGEKVSFAGDRVRVNSAAFYYDYKDYQVTTFKNLGIVLTNADATIKGAELEVEAVPVSGLTLSGGVAVLDTKIEGIARGPNLPRVDREMGEAPKFRANALARYEWPALGGTMSAQVTATHVGERWTDAQNLTVGRLEAYTLVDAQLGYVSADDRFSVLVWGRNITDERVVFNTLATLTFVNIGQQKWTERPLGGVTLRVNF